MRERELALNDPELFLHVHSWPLIIDEIQYAPRLFEIIEQIVNEEYSKNDKNDCMYILTGSEAYNVMNGHNDVNILKNKLKQLYNKKDLSLLIHNLIYNIINFRR